jgi:hypothetical protein
VLGLPYHQVGRQVGQRWNLPQNILDAMAPLPRGGLTASEDPEVLVGSAAAFSSELAAVVAAHPADPVPHVERLRERVEASLPIELVALQALVAAAAEASARYCQLLGESGTLPQFLLGLERAAGCLEPEPKEDLSATMRVGTLPRAAGG